MLRAGLWMVAAGSVWSWSAQGQVVFTSLNDAKLADASSGQIEARLRADSTNWDMRLAFDGIPTPADATANLLDGKAPFEDSSFRFHIDYYSAESVYAFSVTKPDRGTQSIKAVGKDIERINAIRFSTSGSRAKVSLWGVAIKGDGFGFDDFPTLTSAPSVSAYEQSLLYFGDDINLASSDWSMSGVLSFGEYAHFNPSEGAKMNITLLNAIPAPAGGSLLALAGLTVIYRRR